MHKVLSKSIAAELTDLRAASDAGGGTVINSTSKVIELPFGSSWIDITARNFVAAVVTQFALCPRLTIISTTDLLSTTAYTSKQEPTALATYPTQDISNEMQDGDAENFAIDALDTIANNNAIYVGSAVPFRGVAVTIGDPNSTAKVLTVKYPVAKTWTDISDSDGTETGGTTTLAQDGSVTWTVPNPWTRTSLVGIGDTTIKESWSIANLYWTRWEVNGALDASCDIRTMIGLNKSTAYPELIEGKSLEFAVDTDYTAAVEALTDAGTANIIINVAVLDSVLTGKKEVLP